MAERCGCVNSSGSDVKAFCCGPIHSVVIAAALEYSPLDRDARLSVVDVARAELLTPRGLRSLSPRHFGYRGLPCVTTPVMGSPEDPKQELRQRKKRVRMLVIFVGVIIALVFAFRAVLTPFLIALFAAYLLDPLVARMAPLRIFGRL